MNLLPREWCRGPQWLSPAAQSEWEPVLRAAQAAWEELEPLSITAGVRSSALIFVTPDELVRASADCAANDLEVTPLAADGSTLRVAVHRPGLRMTWTAAWAASNDDAIGKLLGFPDCCRQFFRDTWGTSDTRDVTRAMRTVEGPWSANTMLRWLGVRLVPHLPCSADCSATVEQAWRYYDAGRHAGVDVGSIERLLRLPVTYSALGGVAVVETPHFRFMAGTDATEQEERRERRADTSSDAVHHDLAPRTESWHDNGFSTEEAMLEAHAVVSKVVHMGKVNSAADLGCGDGSLLHRISLMNTVDSSQWVGVEVDAFRAARGRLRLAPLVDVRTGRIEDVDLWAGDYDVVLLMPGRLLEMGRADYQAVKARLARARRLVLYAYGDVLAKHGTLQRLADAAGLALISTTVGLPGVQAAEGRVA